ncbi:methyltransferase domain-containing protein [Streptomyces sp. PT12]|uniref:methyltransferase domain-containing protein n=1 Tax=Streptomyces sp. PT12 TaxID=1510197 RepID=UPI000DE26299|nr:methyltransferase domain-containing protein [Streptomyces sp. PT12]RBM23280.1 protein-L-isoaspartate(D-aspartate) O-methyltransferase [Streptomyces sp. PT12]
MTIATRPADGSPRGSAWRAVFDAVPRDAFLPEPGGGDEPHGMLRAMFEALDVPDGGRVLELGTGTGYGAALLCQRFGGERVVSLDPDPEVLGKARARLAGAGYAPALAAGDGARGCLEYAPYGAVVGRPVNGRVPAALLAQVAPGGALAVALSSGIAVLTAGVDATASGRFLPVLARPGAGAAPSVRSYIPALLVPLGTAADVPLPVELSAEVPRFLGGLVQPDVHELSLIDADGRRIYGLVHPGSGSWARVAPRDDGTARIQYDGSRDLWGERAPVLAAWADAGRPRPERYGLGVSADGRHRLWLDTPVDGPGWFLPG